MNMRALGSWPACCLRSQHTAKVVENKRTNRAELALSIDGGQSAKINEKTITVDWDYGLWSYIWLHLTTAYPTLGTEVKEYMKHKAANHLWIRGPNKPKRKTKTSQDMPGKQQMDVRMQRWMLWATAGEVLREKIHYRNKKMDELE